MAVEPVSLREKNLTAAGGVEESPEGSCVGAAFALALPLETFAPTPFLFTACETDKHFVGTISLLEWVEFKEAERM